MSKGQIAINNLTLGELDAKLSELRRWGKERESWDLVYAREQRWRDKLHAARTRIAALLVNPFGVEAELRAIYDATDDGPAT